MDELKKQMQNWRLQGIRRFKIKVGSDPKQDPLRVHALREFLGQEVALMVDANEAYGFRLALKMAEEFARDGVCWFEQPISSTDYEKMRDLRMLFPKGMQLTDGEYIYYLGLARNILQNESADVVQLDVTRCQGVTGFIKAAHLCEAFQMPISSHCAPALHASVAAGARNFLHIEYFCDHARFEEIAFDGAPSVKDGFLHRDSSVPGLGLAFKEADMSRWQI